MKHFSIEEFGIYASLVTAIICLVISIVNICNGDFKSFICELCFACINALLFYLQIRRL